MKRLYTYTDFIQKTTNENVNHFDESNRDFVLNEMQPSWTPEETKSMYEITKENIYQKLKDKFFQRIDIILTGDEDLFSSSKSGAFGSYYDSEMAKKIDGKSTYKEISDKIKKVWNDKILSRLNFTSDLQSGYDTIKNSKRNDLISDGFKNSYDIVIGAYESTTWGEGRKVLDTLLWQKSPFYKTKTDSIFSESGINSDQEYNSILKKLKDVKISDGTFPWKDLDAKLKFEFFEYYRHYHFWLFANLIMSGKPQSTASTTAPSSKTKSSSSSTTSTTSSPKRERLNVDRNAVGERFSGL
jgi:hypothetical protein